LRQIALNCVFEKHGQNQVFKPIGRGTFVNKLNAEALMEEIQALLTFYAALGAEGLAVKDLDSVYTFSASKTSSTRSWLKIKAYEDCEARVVGKYEATDKHPKGVVVELPSGVRQNVQFANNRLIADDTLKIDMIVRMDFMPEAHRESEKKRTPIIRAIVTDTVSWAEIKEREQAKQAEAQ
jgi:hypothetical protein